MLISMKDLTTIHGVRPTSVLHLGAHLGEEARDYGDVGARHTWWVEANPALIPGLEAHLRRVLGRHRWTVLHALVGEHEGQSATLRLTNKTMSSSVLPLGTHATEHPEIWMTGEEIAMSVSTVDMLAARHGITADFLNVDLQGYELAALRGAVRFLAEVQWVYTEVNEAELYVGCPLVTELDEYLGAHGFERVATEMTRHGWGDALYSRGG